MSLENELTQAALDKFKNKATLIQNSLNMKGYKILDLDVSSVNEQTMSPRPLYDGDGEICRYECGGFFWRWLSGKW